MAYTFQVLQQEFFARGFDFMSDGGAGLARAQRFINDAMHQVDDLEDWPYLNASTTGVVPLTLTDLDRVEKVKTPGSGLTLIQRSRSEVLDWYGDVTTPGTAREFYITGGSTVNVYPTDASTQFQVTYWKFGPDLVANGDVPLMPDRFRYAIVEYAVARALEDEAPDQAAVASQAGDVIVQRMRNWAGQLEPDRTVITALGDDL